MWRDRKGRKRVQTGRAGTRWRDAYDLVERVRVVAAVRLIPHVVASASARLRADANVPEFFPGVAFPGVLWAADAIGTHRAMSGRLYSLDPATIPRLVS